MLFISLSQFRTMVGLTPTAPISIVKNPNTAKLFANTEVGNYKVQQNLDITLPIRFMYESEETLSEGCIANVNPGEVIAIL